MDELRWTPVISAAELPKQFRFVTQGRAWDNFDGWYITRTAPRLQVWDGKEWRYVPVVDDNDVGPRPVGMFATPADKVDQT